MNPCEDPCKIYPFKGVDFTAEEINSLLKSIQNKVDRGEVQDGLSAYKIAVANGYQGTEEQWLASLRGAKGDPLKFVDLTNDEIDEIRGPKGNDGISTTPDNLEIVNDLEGEGTNKAKVYTLGASVGPDILKRINRQKEDVNAAKDEAIKAIDETEQAAISNFSSQRVTPEMLSEATKQFIEASGGGNITNLADDEDIQSKENELGINVLKLADRRYDKVNFSGKGYKILRKNIVDEKNVLTQEMINEANTIYEVRYDFELNGAEITIPENCILKFEGGSLNNGILHGNRIAIKSSIEKIFQEIEFDENFFLNNVCPEWFGVIQNVDCSAIIQYLLDKKCDIKFGVGTYLLANLIIMSKGTSLSGQYSNTILNCAGIYMNVQTNIYDIQLVPISHEIDFLICISNQYVTAAYARIGIRNIYAQGLKNKETNTSIIDFKINGGGFHSIDIDSVRSDGYFGHGIKIYSQNRGWLTNLRVSNCFFYALRTTIDINADAVSNIFQDFKFTNVESQYNADFTENFVKIGSISRTIFDGCTCWDSINKIDIQYYVYNDSVSISIVNEIENTPIDDLIKTENGKVGLPALLSHVISYSTLDMAGLNIMRAKSFSNNEQIVNEDAVKTLNGWISFNTDKPYSATEPYQFRGLRLTNINAFALKRSDTLIGMSAGDKPCCGTINNDGVNLWFIYSENFIPYCNENNRGVGKCIGHLKYDTTINKPIWWNKTFARWETSDGNPANVKNYGTFAEKPAASDGIKLGFQYFCTDKQTSEGGNNGIVIYYKGGDNWVDALGRIVE